MTQTKAELLQTRHQGDIKLGDADSSHYVGFKAPATVGTSLVWTLPAADGSNGYALTTNGSGVLSWSQDASGIPASGGTFTGAIIFENDVTFDGATAGRDIVFDRSDDALEFADNAKARFGASNDLEIYHSGSESFIADEGTGGITISSGTLSFKNQARDETYATMQVNGPCSLYHDNVKTFTTDPNGIKVLGPEGYSADLYLWADEGDDNADQWRLQASTSGEFTLKNNASGSLETNIKAVGNGAVELYHDNVKKLETTAQAVKITGGVAQVATAMGALEVDCNTSNYFTKTISGNSTFTFANPAASGQATAFTLELTHSSGTVTWPSSVKWNADTAPTLTAGKTHLFMFVTDDGGTRWRGSALVDYVN